MGFEPDHRHGSPAELEIFDTRICAPTIFEPQTGPPTLRRSPRERTAPVSLLDRCGCMDNCSSKACLNRSTLVECDSDNCALDWCQNRPLSDPPRRALTVFDTGSRRGRGLRTDKSLPQGAFVAEITGRVRSARGPNSGIRGGSHYRIALGGGRMLDAQCVDSQARYLNHSCDPNCEAWLWEGADGRSHIGVFTHVHVAAGTELTIRYHWSTRNKTNKGKRPPPKQRGRQECLCGSPKCCGLLWAP